MKQLFLILSLFALPFLSSANVNPTVFGTVTGTILDQEFKEPIPYATISVLNPAEEIVIGTVSSTEGTFNLEDIPEGNYLLKIQFMGYTPYSTELNITESSQSISLGTIFLEAAVAQLNDVTVVAEVSTIEQRIDRKVINVGKDLTTAGASAADIMNNLPSVSVDIDGNIALRGNQNVRVLLDGKPTHMDAATLLKQIPSSSIKQIELITNPSAKYNPEGMSGIINIILHKNVKLGFNGDLNAGVTIGEKLRSNGALNLNYRNGKFNFYTNLGASDRNYLQKIELTNLDSNSAERLTFDDGTQSYLAKVGVDFYMDDKNIFSFYTNQNLSYENTDGLSAIDYFNEPARNYTQLIDLNQDNQSSTYNFDYRHLFNDEGHSIELEVDYNEYHNEDEAIFNYVDAAPALTSYEDNVDKVFHSTTVNLDYVYPISEVSKLELGAETRIRNTDNEYATSNAGLDDIFYTYDSEIHSLYATFGQNYEQWSYQMGARLENYSVDAQQAGQQIYSDDRWTLYPSAFVTFTPSENNSFQASYSRRVDRPSLNQVSPLRQITTPRLTVSGNPELEPQYTNSMELNYTRRLGNHSITAGVFYRLINDDINQIMLQDPENPEHIILTYHNTDDNSAYGTEVSGRFKPASFWDFNVDFNLYSQTLKGIIGGESIEEDNTSWRATTNNTFKVTEQLKLQAFAMYNAPQKSLQFDVDEFYFVNLGARYSFWEDKASVSVNLSDVFKTQVQEISTDRPQRQVGIFQGDTRTVYLGFSYRFGGNDAKALQRKERDEGTSGGGGIF